MMGLSSLPTGAHLNLIKARSPLKALHHLQEINRKPHIFIPTGAWSPDQPRSRCFISKQHPQLAVSRLLHRDAPRAGPGTGTAAQSALVRGETFFWLLYFSALGLLYSCYKS